MTHDEIKIASVGSVESLSALNTCLTEGFVILGDPLVVNDCVTFVLIRKGKPDSLRYATPYPSDKQLGYVVWAYDLPGGYAASLNLTRKECGKLIEGHKDVSEGIPLTKEFFDSALNSLRKEKPPVFVDKAPAQFDDDIPF